MMNSGKTRFLALLAGLFVAFTMVSVDHADARRGGSFGSRGTRTFSTPAPTRTAPAPTGPVQRSMTPNTGVNNPATNPGARANPAAAQRPGLFSGGMMRGLLMGGLLGALLGFGFGGAAGMMSFLFQILVFGLIAYLIMGFLRRRQQPATAGGPQNAAMGGGNGFDFGGGSMNREAAGQTGPSQNRAGGFAIPGFGGGAQAQPQTKDIEVTQADLETFERRLTEVQTAYGKEDFASLRRYSTPEMVSFFSEELADNAKSGVRNDVSQVRLLQADIAEAWNEGDDDYATAAFMYESVDVMRDRTSGRIVEGEDRPTETTELWTFVRNRGGDWKLSAIQEARSN